MKHPQIRFALSLLVLVLVRATPGVTDELVMPAAVFRALGYQPAPAPTDHLTKSKLAEPPMNTPWPVVFQDAAHSVAQNYVNFQSYEEGDVYYHGGCDLRSVGGSEVRAPVTGRLEGGFYGYTDNSDGSMVKQWKPWAGQADHDPYFELALVTDDGFRYELHHVDSEKLPDFTVQALNQGGVMVQAGTVIGTVNDWAFADLDYDHVHYNIIRADGVRMNPEYYSAPAVPDHTAPVIRGVYALTSAASDGRALELKAGESAPKGTVELVIAATDSHDGDAYVQTPPFIQVTTASGTASGWDFRKTLAAADGTWPDIRKVFEMEITLGDSSTLDTSGQYGAGLFLFRFAVDSSMQGPFTITVGDTAGNQSKFLGTL